MISIDRTAFRKMRESDVAAVTYMLEAACEYPWSERQVLDSLQGSHESWVGCEPGGGVAAYGVVSYTLDDCELLNLCVLPGRQRQGWGRAMMDFLIERAALARQRSVLLEVRASNQAAIRLYEGCGFQRLATRKAYYPAAHGEREDAWLYSLSLS